MDYKLVYLLLLIAIWLFFVRQDLFTPETQESANQFYRMIAVDRDNMEKRAMSDDNLNLASRIQETLLNKLKTRECDKFSEPEDVPFVCPSFEDLDKLPGQAEGCPAVPKYPAVYNSSFFPIYSPGFPGPSEQTQGHKHIFMATALLGKSLMINNFTTHNHSFIIPEKMFFENLADPEGVFSIFQNSRCLLFG